MKGALVQADNVSAGGNVDVSQLPSGIYTMLIRTEATARFVKH